jgi:hypothetical protein
MVEISKSGSGEGLGGATRRGYSTSCSLFSRFASLNYSPGFSLAAGPQL